MDDQTQNNQTEEMVPGSDLDKCTAERDEYLSGWQRAKADFANYKKEELRRVEELARYGSEEIIRDLIGVMDNFDLGLAALEKQGPVEKGIYMIRGQIEDLVRKRGVERIPLTPGDPYNPAVAEVLAEEPSEHHPPGSVLEVVSPGYRRAERVIRPARVKIVKHEA